MARYLPQVGRGGSFGGGGGVGTDRFAPRYLVGNTPEGDPAVAQAAPFQYIPDTGDGAGIAAAVAAANANGGGDIFIRSGTYDLSTGAVTGFVVTAPSVAIRGAGFETIIRGRDDARSVFDFTVVDLAILESMMISMPAAAAGAAGLDVVNTGNRGAVRNVTVEFDVSGVANANESLTAVFRDPGTGRHHNLRVLLCPFTGEQGSVGQLACYDLSGTFTMLTQCEADQGDRPARLSGEGHRLGQFYGTPGLGGLEILGNRHIVDVSLVSGSTLTDPLVLVDTSTNVQVRGMLRNTKGATVALRTGAGATGTGVQSVTFEGYGIAVDIVAGASATTVLGCQLGGGTIDDAGALTEQAHNQP
jgi:hypothetical protein